jgi:hypothetical protein
MNRQEAVERILNLTRGGEFAVNLLKTIRIADSVNLILLSRGFPNEVEAHLVYTQGITLEQFTNNTELKNSLNDTAEYNRKWHEGY